VVATELEKGRTIVVKSGEVEIENRVKN